MVKERVEWNTYLKPPERYAPPRGGLGNVESNIPDPKHTATGCSRTTTTTATAAIINIARRS